MSETAGAGTEHPNPSALAPTDSPGEGKVVAGRFVVGALRDRGNGFVVHAAQDTQSQEQTAEVSLLLIRLDQLGNRKTILVSNLQRIQSAATPRQMTRTLAFGEHQGFFYVASELPDGHPLRKAVDASKAQGKTVGAKTAHTLLGHIAAGLTEAASIMAHGALNPANVIVGRDGKIVVEHLGIVQAVPDIGRRGFAKGAPPNVFVAPELEGGGTPSPQSDVFSMGAILYELLTAHTPTAPLRPPSQLAADVSPALDALVTKALSRSPMSRQGTPQILIAELAAALGLPVEAPAPAPRLPPGLAGAPLPLRPTEGPSALGVPRITGRTFNVAEAAGMDTDSERWLIQKGRLDFGPFSMAVLKQQIERGHFGLEDYVTDTETGERKRIKDDPKLADFTRRAERNLAETQRAHAEVNLQSAERKKGRMASFIIGISVIVIGSAFGLYMVGREDADDSVMADRVAEGDIDAFLKNVKIAFNQPKKPQRGRKARAGGGKGPGGDDAFDTSQVLGDVTQGGGDAVLDEGAIQQVMMSNYRKLIPCVMQEKGRNPGLQQIDLEFVVMGSGKVSAARVNGERTGAFPACIEGRLKTVNFPKFDGGKTVASWSMSIR